MLKANNFSINSYNNSKDAQLEENNSEIFNIEKIYNKITTGKYISKSEKIKNEYYCNLLISISNKNILDKLDYYQLLYSFNSNPEDKNYKYYIFKKVNKYINTIFENEKKVDLSNFNEMMMQQIKFLKEENNLFYCYYYLLNGKTYKSPNEIKNIKDKINNEIISLIEEKQKFFEKFEQNELDKISEILKNTKDNKNSFDINENLYAINNIWLFKAIIFLDNISNINKNKNERKKKFEQTFNLYQVYNSYFKQNDKKYIYYPGPIDNYYISDYKDIWNDLLSDDENYMIKNGLKLGENYSLMKEKDWMLIKEIFGTTNEIKRKINNLELLRIKVIIFDKRKIEHNKFNNLKQKYIQIGKNKSIQDLKEKILRCFNYLFEKNVEENNIKKDTKDGEINIKDKNINDKNKENLEKNTENEIIDEKINIDNNSIDNKDNKEKIKFYKLSKNNKQLLIEIFTAFINKIPTYESINLEEININDDSSLDLLFDNYNSIKDILLIEIIRENSNPFFSIKTKNEKGLYQCSICKKDFPLKNKYNCNICHMSFYCSQICAESHSNENHIKLHEYLNEFIMKKFDLKLFLKLELNTSKFNDCLVGLTNLGNTCFINSSLQCLFNTYDLSKYFLSNYFKEEINKKNNLGYRGLIAESYADLLYEIKTTINSFINPINFIKIFFKNNKSLNLKGQQDAQEFLSLLLDSLHEDLNRITHKPYIQLEEQKENESDFDASQRYWDYYKKREDSIIIDLFHGQFKSKITCLNCNKSSITYDPFIFLGLPIPHQRDQVLLKFFFGDKCEYLGINIDKKTQIKDLKKKAIEIMRMNNYKNELSNDELYGVIEIVGIDKYKMVRKIYNKNYKAHNFDFLSSILNDAENLEIVLYEKNLDEKYFNIYIYPIKGNEYDNSSYPIALSVKPEMNFHEIIEENKEKIISMYTNLHQEDKINVGLVHKINGDWYYYFTNGFDSKEVCPLCKTEDKYCQLYEYESIIDILKRIKKKNKDFGPALFAIGNKTKNVVNKKLISDKYYKNGLFFLSDCLKLFCEEELLNNDNLWYCNKCKKHKAAKKQIRLYKLPIYLIIQLKKFKNSAGFFSPTNEKKETYIKYPINNLDLSEYIEDFGGKKEKYDLYAVIQHHGEISQGHYTAICKINDKWYLFNDSKYFLINNPINRDA